MPQTVEDFEDFEDVLSEAEERARGDWELNFVADMRDRYEEYGDRMRLSDRQWDKLREIAGEEIDDGEVKSWLYDD